jgi:hypothetical protein
LATIGRPTIVDVGAYFGSVAEKLSQGACPSVEPDPRSYERLCATLKSAARASPEFRHMVIVVVPDEE